MAETKKCAICGSRKIEFAFRNKDRLYGIDRKVFEWSKCSNCGVLFLNPTPSPEELSRYYPDNYISKKNQSDKRNRMISWLYDLFYVKKNIPLKILFFPLKNLLRTMPKKGKFLDVGCGNGRFLILAKKNGIDVHGVDPFIEGDIPELNVLNKNLVEAKYPDKFFDTISLNNVLEHTQDPLDMLKECKRILKDDGEILVNVPNSSSLNRFIFGSKWVSLDTPRHTFIFADKTMKTICGNLSLKIDKRSYKSEPFMLIGSLFYIFSKSNRLCDSKFLSHPFANIVFMPYSMLTNLFRVGDQIEYTIVK